MKTKPFDLEAFKAGAKAVTRGGILVDEFLYHSTKALFMDRLGIRIGSSVQTRYENGMAHKDFESRHDLFLAVPTRSINGHEYPEPERVAPENGAQYWLVNTENLAVRLTWRGDRFDLMCLKRGLVHLTRDNAEQHAQAIILAGGGEV